MPSANGFTSAVMDTRLMGSARIAVDMTVTSDGATRSLAGKGPIVLDRGWGDLTWTLAEGQMRELSNEQGIFTQVAPPAGTWTKREPGMSTPTSGAANPLRNLGTMADVVDHGREVLAGVPLTRVTGTVPADPPELVALGLTPQEIAAIGDSWQGASVYVTTWLDARGRIVRVDRELGFDNGTTVLTTTTLSKFGDFIDLTSPSSDMVQTATAG